MNTVQLLLSIGNSLPSFLSKKTVLLPILVVILFAAGALCLIQLIGRAVTPILETSSDTGIPSPIIESGKQIVSSVYQYEYDYEVWPTSLHDLVPHYISPDLINGWHFSKDSEGDWLLVNYYKPPHSAIQYRHADHSGNWQILGEFAHDAAIYQPLPKSPHRKMVERVSATEEALLYRLAAYPNQLVHFQGAITFYCEREQYSKARKLCWQCLQSWPDHWWPNAMLSHLDWQLGLHLEADTAILKWVDKERTSVRLLYLAQYYYTSNRTEIAMECLREMSRTPLSVLHGNPDAGEEFGVRAEAFAWEGCRMAYEAKQFNITLAICDQWEEFTKKNYSGEDSFYAIRAACYLSLGQFSRAEEQIALAFSCKELSNTWADNLKELKDAILRRDTHYCYSPGNYPKPMSLFVNYR